MFTAYTISIKINRKFFFKNTCILEIIANFLSDIFMGFYKHRSLFDLVFSFENKSVFNEIQIIISIFLNGESSWGKEQAISSHNEISAAKRI